MMKKRRGKVLKRLCRSSYYCSSRNSDRENPMKTEEHLEPTAVFIQRVTAAVSELKDHLQQDYERTYPGLGEIIRIVLDEEEAKAWGLSFSRTCSCPTWWKRTSPISICSRWRRSMKMFSSGTTSTNLKPINLPSRHVHRKANGFHHEQIRLRKTAK